MIKNERGFRSNDQMFLDQYGQETQMMSEIKEIRKIKKNVAILS